MNCQQFREMLDSYISGELLVETNHDFLRHLENCPACRQELKARRQLRLQLRSAVINTPDAKINPAFAARLEARLRQQALSPQVGWWKRLVGNASFSNPKLLLAFAASLVFTIGCGLFLIKYQSNSTNEDSVAANNQPDKLISPTESPSPLGEILQAAWHEMANLALGDHKNCALEFKLKDKPITLTEASKKYGKFNENLNQVVIEPLREVFPEKSADEIKLLAAHSCIFNGHRFAHIVLRQREHTFSVLVTNSDLPNNVGEEIISHTTDGYQIAGFRTKSHFVFVVSDATPAENDGIIRTIAAPVKKHLKAFESKA